MRVFVFLCVNVYTRAILEQAPCFAHVPSVCVADLSVSILQAMASGSAAMEQDLALTRVPLISLISVGWSDVPDNYQRLMGYVFDIQSLGEDADSIGGKWNSFGGEGGKIDRHLNEIRGMPELKN